MTNEWNRVSDLFGAVRLLDEPARVAFLDVACSGESSSRQIESLLADAVTTAVSSSSYRRPPRLTLHIRSCCQDTC
jgi:hypothetical protein